jgi:hypothetical protein
LLGEEEGLRLGLLEVELDGLELGELDGEDDPVEPVS